MKHQIPTALFLVCLGLAATLPHVIQAAESPVPKGSLQKTASITGQVSNISTQDYLEGAVVELAGTNRSAVTDREGRFQFYGVSSGPATLIVSFSGLDQQRIPVVAEAGQTLTRNIELTSSIYQLEKFTVAGEREGTAKAEALQRQAPNVKTIVSSDTFGHIQGSIRRKF